MIAPDVNVFRDHADFDYIPALCADMRSTGRLYIQLKLEAVATVVGAEVFEWGAVCVAVSHFDGKDRETCTNLE
jgi:hypothetical protein